MRTAWPLLLPLLFTGCASGPILIPANAEARIDSQVDIVAWSGTQAPVVGAMFGTSTDIMNFKVENLSSELMTLDRDAVFLVGPAGRVNRDPGGSQTLYSIAPGAVHDVNVRFPRDGFERGQMVSVHFEEAVAIAGRRVVTTPLTFQVR